MADETHSKDKLGESIESLSQECEALQTKLETINAQIQTIEAAMNSVGQLKGEIDTLHKIYLALLDEDFKRRVEYYPIIANKILLEEFVRLGGEVAPAPGAKGAPPAPAAKGAAPAPAKK